MAKKDAYTEFLKQDFQRLFDQMELNDIQRHFLGSRWLDQVLWMEKKASHCRDQHYRLRLTAIVLGVLVPVLIGFEFENDHLQVVKKYLTIGMGSVVAVSAAVEEFFHYGERWNHYRRTVESLKTQGWQYSQLSGEYSTYPTHSQAFSSFAQTIEELIQRDVEVYVTQLSRPEEKAASTEDTEDT
jgi:hypothetical protein